MKTSKNSNTTAKRILKKKGWSYRAAAPELGVHFSHLNHVLNGRRESAALINRIKELPPKRELLNNI